MTTQAPEFDHFAEEYNRLLHDPIRERFAPGSRFFTARKWELLKRFYQRTGRDLSKTSWLDIGCGFGELLSLGRSYVQKAAGCDPSTAMLQRCRDLEFRLQPSPVSLPYQDGSFELVTAVCVYHHVQSDMRLALTAEVRRVLTDGGLFCIIEHNPLNPVTQVIVRRTPVDADAHLLSAIRARALLRAQHLEPIHTEYFLYIPEGLFNVLGPIERLLARLPFGGQYATVARKSANYAADSPNDQCPQPSVEPDLCAGPVARPAA